VKTRHLIPAAVGLIVLAALIVAAIALGRHLDRSESLHASQDRRSRDFMFQVVGVWTPNQGGHRINLFFHYRYNDGIANNEIPDYTKVRQKALDHLNTADVSKNPYWEVLNNQLCAQLKTDYPFQAISCQIQVVGVENPPPHDEPGYRSSTETIGDIEPLAIPGPATP
jgi:hypothetical protein